MPLAEGKSRLEIIEKNTPTFSSGDYFVYPFDPNLFVYHDLPENTVLFGNTTPRYDYFVDYGSLPRNSLHDCTALFVEAAEYVGRRIDNIQRVLGPHPAKKWLQRVPLNRSENLAEALQSILFINGLVWQQGTTLIGLGRVDKYLARFLEETQSDIDSAKAMFRDFLTLLHKDYVRKSNLLFGDTGQVIVLGGRDILGGNLITEIILETLLDLHIPDPKIVFRFSGEESPRIRELIFQCIESGLGYPLLLNEISMQKFLTRFGYQTDEVVDFVVAACWEPILPKKGCAIANALDFNYLEVLLRCLNCERAYPDFPHLVEEYLQALNVQAIVDSKKAKSRHIAFDFFLYYVFKLPFLITEENFTGTGNDSPGVLSVGLVNTVDALLAIKELVYDRKTRTLQDFMPGTITDETRKMATSVSLFFGINHPEVIDLTNRVIDAASTPFKETGVKMGLVSPSDLRIGQKTPRTPDGREDHEPLAHHLAPNRGNFSLSETFSFLSRIEAYRQAFNGSTLEATLTKSSAKNKDVQNIIWEGIRSYVYSLQINVLDVEELEAALENPGQYPHLIVRVWGFSTYFRDLPPEYQRQLVERARRDAHL